MATTANVPLSAATQGLMSRISQLSLGQFSTLSWSHLFCIISRYIFLAFWVTASDAQPGTGLRKIQTEREECGSAGWTVPPLAAKEEPTWSKMFMAGIAAVRRSGEAQEAPHPPPPPQCFVLGVHRTSSYPDPQLRQRRNKPQHKQMGAHRIGHIHKFWSTPTVLE